MITGPFLSCFAAHFFDHHNSLNYSILGYGESLEFFRNILDILIEKEFFRLKIAILFIP